jgi:hypothetical protein
MVLGLVVRRTVCPHLPATVNVAWSHDAQLPGSTAKKQLQPDHIGHHVAQMRQDRQHMLRRDRPYLATLAGSAATLPQPLDRIERS